MRLKLLIFCLFIIITSVSKAQINPDNILIDNKKSPKILLVGTFHFAYFDQDQYKTEESNRVNILSKKRQEEVLELVDYIAKFKPNKIFVEDFNKHNVLMTNYKNYKKGKYKLTTDEIDQVAFRLSNKFDLDTIYAVDSRTIAQDLYENDNTIHYIKSLKKKVSNEKISPTLAKYHKWYELDDKYLLENSLLDYFKLLNSEKYQERGFYSMFLTSFKGENLEGADDLTLDLVSRNIRILHKITQNITSKNDRILILFGSSHTEFFKVFFESSPEYELIKFNEL
ncbi:DUF5694 domain-containing protein [Myroides odoratimimus]|uniref:DUF5694 domain-containing protein n=1 Tax=Myroides odoratimimus TaxID=76832 RepID=UPI002574F4AC|nr:DUF5694 domain-containing protein [Myroides odoratimimus]MDM1326438.1 hypothetical protein [Myroides odoratimimus]MDM1514211.1 hypothetical protein [Myroides odoratimimus]